MSPLQQGCVAAALLSSLVPFARSAAADEIRRDVCFDSYEQAQRLRNDGKLRAASERLAACVDRACPEFVRKDCTAWLDDVHARISGVVIRAPGAQNGSAKVAAVSIDGERVADGDDGPAIPVDPGPHELTYELDGRSHQQHVVVPEGDKAFTVVLDVGEPAPPAPAAQTAPQERSRWLRLPTASYALGGGAVLGLASFAAFALAGESVQQCAPRCSASQVSTLRRDYVIADISLATAAAAAAGALYFALTWSSEAPGGARPTPRATAWWLGMGVAAGGASLGGGAKF